MNSPEFSYNTPKNDINNSPNSTVKFFISELGPERLQELSDFADELDVIDCKEFKTNEEIENTFHEYNKETLTSLANEEIGSIKEYSGYNYKYINSVMRGIWNYEELGVHSDEKEKRFLDAAGTISKSIQKSPRLPENVKTFRGANLSSFRGYNVQNLEDLNQLEGQLFYEQGFTSSSLKSDQSFANKKFDDTYREQCNIEIEYLVPSGSHDGVAMLSNDLSYSPGQKEYLFDKGSLFKILNVDVANDNAHIKMALLPKDLWDRPRR